MGMVLAKSINSTIDRIQLVSVEIKFAFAEPNQNLHILVTNTSSENLEELSVSLKNKDSLKVKFRLGPQESLVIDYPWSVPTRGYHALPTVVVSSEYPSGLFHAWKILKSQSQILVYPSRKGDVRFPLLQAQSQDSIGVIREIRDYRPGDSPKRIHWRSLAKNQQLRTLVHEADAEKKCEFKWNDLPRLDLESKLSQICLWVDQAEKNGYDWTLRLPNRVIHRHLKPEAYQQALTALALWEIST